MAAQNISINIGSSFNGEGMVKAAKSVNTFGQTVNRTAGGVQKMASGIGALGGVLGQLPGKIGGVASGIGDLVSSLTMGAGGITTFVAACGALGVAIGKKVFEPIREASREWRKFHDSLVSMEDGKGTHEIYQKRFAKMDAERQKREAERQRAQEKKNRADDAAHRASVELLKSENALLKTERELAKLRESGKWDKRIVGEKDEGARNLLTKQKALALAKMDGANSVADATAARDEAWKSYRVERRDSLSDGEYNAKDKAGSRVVQAAEVRLAIAQETAAQSIAQAEREVKDATESLERSRAEAVEKERKRLDDEARAEKERRDAQRKKDDERNAAQKELADVTKKLTRATAQRERAEKTRERVDSGIAKDQQVHGGISGGGYTYNRDKDGNITRFDQFRRSRRYADRAARDEASANRDGNAERNARRARDIEKNIRKGRNVSDRDRNFLRDWNDFKNQKAPEDETVKKLDEIKQMLEKTLELK